MKRLLLDFVVNLWAGMKLASFRRCGLDDFRFSLNQFVLLLLLDLALEIGAGWWLHKPDPDFNIQALPIYTFNLSCFFIAAYFIGLLARNSDTVLRLGIIVYSFGPLATLLNTWMEYQHHQPKTAGKPSLWLAHGVSVYLLALICRAVFVAVERKKLKTAAGFVLMLVFGLVPVAYFHEDGKFWYAAEAEEEEKDEYAAYRNLDAETLLYRQPELLKQALAKLAPQRKKTSDIYFVGFASYAHQEVFAKEVAYAQKLLDERFDTQGRSITLVNHLRSMDETPLATATNLAATLKHIGQLMDPEEDILLLYLTSHGSREHELAVSFWPMPLNDITPDKLNAMLDAAGIQWRVVIVSACYSGGFVQSLQGLKTVVATAAAADRTSFGCGNEFDFTYFGEAVFKDQLQRQYSLVTALREADAAIGRREERERLTPSLPQLSVGEAIAAKLEHLGEDIQQRRCAAAKASHASC